jgi:hypothetical protein
LTADSAWSNTAQIAQVPVAAVSPLSLAFGDQVVLTTSAPQTVTLSNSGVVALTITSIGATPGDYAQTNTCGASLAAGGSCTIDVTFTPATVATILGSLDVVTVENGTLSVALSGTGVAAPAPVASVAPTSLLFPDTNVGSTSAAQTVTLSNTGTAPLTSTITLTGANPGDFVQTNACGTVAVGATCSISVSFSPTVAGALSANLSIATNDPVNPTLTVTLSGTGLSVLTVPAAPTNLTGTAVRNNRTTDRITLNWIDNANNEAGFLVQRAQVGNLVTACDNPTLAFTSVGSVGANVTTYSEVATRVGNLCYRVQAFNAAGSSAWSNVLRVVTP